MEPSIASSKSNDQILAEALERGYVLLNISKVVTSGAAGSGKTGTRYVLLGVNPSPVRSSTSLFHIWRVFCDKLLATNKLARWFTVSFSHLNEMIAKAIKKGVSHEPVKHQDVSKASNFGDRSESSELDSDTISSDFSMKRKGATEKGKKQGKQEDYTITRQDILQMMKEHTGSDELMRLHWIYFIDSGGRPQFYDLLPAFVKDKTVIMLIVKLSERLDEYPTIQYYKHGDKYEEHISRSTNYQILQQYCSTLVSGGKDSCVLVIGTHRDFPCDETIEQKDEIIAGLLKSLGNHLIQQCPLEGKVLYPLNAKCPSQTDFDMAALIRRQITNKNCTQQVKVPIAWFLLEQDIQQLENSVISLQDCRQLALPLKIDHQALSAALQYFNRFCILLYFPVALPNVVFTSSQVVIDKVTEIVDFSYYLKSLEDEHSERRQWSTFLDFGIVTKEMLLEKFPSHYVPNIFTVNDLLDLFQHLLIVAQLNCSEFVMPAMLPVISPQDINRLEPSFGSLNPLLIYFPDGCAPGGTFCCLSTYLVSRCGWRIADTFYRNMLKFEVGNITVTLIDNFYYFKVYIQGPSSTLSSTCKWVVSSISTGLSKAYIALNYGTVDHSVGVLCPCGKGEHAATLDKQLLHWTCTQTSNVSGKVNEEFAPWHHLHSYVELSSEASKCIICYYICNVL